MVKIQARQVRLRTVYYCVILRAHPIRLIFSYQQRVNALQEYIQALENEKRTGARDIDEIQSEINRKRGEITELSRKHLNYFYYF